MKSPHRYGPWYEGEGVEACNGQQGVEVWKGFGFQGSRDLDGAEAA